MLGAVKTDNKVIEDMFGAGAHYGYSKSRRHPSAKPFIYGSKNRVEIFDLEKTSKLLEKALDFVTELGKENKKILFVSKTGLLYVAGRWIGGTLTNFSEIRKRIQKYLDLKEKKEKGELSKYTKKERLLIDRDLNDLESKFGGIFKMEGLPQALFVVDSKQEHTAVTEAEKMGIPVISLSSTDCNLEDVDYAIPGNDSSLSSIKFFVSKVAESYNKAKS
jgi:small subunit ribosomal protein S2